MKQRAELLCRVHSLVGRLGPSEAARSVVAFFRNSDICLDSLEEAVREVSEES